MASRHLLTGATRALRVCIPTASLHTTTCCSWQKFENERHFEPGEDILGRTWHGLTYDWRRWRRRYYEVRILNYIKKKTIFIEKSGKFMNIKNSSFKCLEGKKKKWNFEARKDAWKKRHPVAHMKYAPMDHEMWPHRAEITIIGGGLAGIFIFTFFRTSQCQARRLPTGSSSALGTRTSRWSSSKTTIISWKVVSSF